MATLHHASYGRGVDWPAGFDPDNLTKHASLNRLVVEVSGAPLARFNGMEGAALLSRDAVRDLVVTELGGIDVPEDGVTDVLAAAGPSATRVIDELGDRLAALVATLREPSAVEEAADERRPYVEAWNLVDEVVLGGGLAGGVVGQALAGRATAVLRAAGLDDPPPVRPSPLAPWLALVGAARSVPPGENGARLVLDAGQTAIKRGLARVEGGELAGLRLLPPFPVHPTVDVAAVVSDAAADGLAGAETIGDVVMSIAAYVRDERPIVDRASPYELLAARAEEIEARLGRCVRMVHDGTAAWRGSGSMSGRPSAVIAMGTWLGVGFGPQRQSLMPVSAPFVLDSS